MINSVICLRPTFYYQFTSELLENLEEMFPRYYMDSNISGMFKYSTNTIVCTHRQMVKLLRKYICGLVFSILDLKVFIEEVFEH